MPVSVINHTKQRVQSALIRKAVEATLQNRKRKGDITVIIIGKARMRSLNRRYRGKDRPTDVLSFAEDESSLAEKGFLGELFIAIDVIKQQARQFAPSEKWELAFIAIHGTLHLLGYEDETDTGMKKMEKLGHTIIRQVLN